MNSRTIAKIVSTRATRGPKRRVNAASCVAYVRVSTDKQTLGPHAQREAIEAYARSHKLEIVAWHTESESASENKLEDRTELWSAFETARSARVGVFLVAKRDRLARDATTTELLRRELMRHGVKLLSADGKSDDVSPEGRLMTQVLDAVAEYERALIRGRTRAALRAKRIRGEATGGAAPFGHQKDAEGRLIERDDEQRIIAMIRTMRTDGLTIRDIANTLTQDRIPARGSRWHSTTVARILDRTQTELKA